MPLINRIKSDCIHICQSLQVCTSLWSHPQRREGVSFKTHILFWPLPYQCFVDLLLSLLPL